MTFTEFLNSPQVLNFLVPLWSILLTVMLILKLEAMIRRRGTSQLEYELLVRVANKIDALLFPVASTTDLDPPSDTRSHH